jgi:HK97 family phage portal protein
MYGMVVDFVLIGNTIEWYASASNQLMTIPAESVTLDLGGNGRLMSYSVSEYESNAGRLNLTTTAKFLPTDIIHLRRPNPSSLLWGLSPFIPGRKSILFNRYSQDYLNSFYQKGAIPGFSLQLDKEANERVALRLLRSFENTYTGRRNMRRTIILPKGVSMKEMAHTLADQELSVHIDKNRETIINLLKVPKHELSLQAAGSLGSEEAKSALKNFWHATLIPTMRIFEGEFTKFFRRRGILAEHEFLEFDLENVEALQEDLQQKATLAKMLLDSGWSVNEVRTKIWELEEAESADADTPYIIRPPAQTGFGQFGLSAQPAAQASAPGLDIPKADILALESPETSALSETAAEDKGNAPVRAKAAKDALSTYLKGGDGWFDRREAAVREDAKKGVTEMERAALGMFADMASTIIKTTKTFLKEKGWHEIATKADEAAKPAKLIKREELRRRLRKALDKYEEQWIDDSRKILSARVDTGYGVALDLPFNMASENEIQALRARGQAAREDALEERSARVFKYLNETTIERVFSTIERGVDESKTVQQIADDLREKFANVEEIGARAMTIARTETLTAVSLGQAAAMKDAASIVPDLQKMWISADDERTRKNHAELHGDIVKWDKDFGNGLAFPRDPSGAADEVINCRCTWIMVPKDQMNNIDSGLVADEET